MRPSLFWHVTQRSSVVSYRRFGTNWRYGRQASSAFNRHAPREFNNI